MKTSVLVLLLMFFINIGAANAQISFAPLVEELMPTVVNISTDIKKTEDSPEVLNNLIFDEKDRENLGSGFIIDSQGYIATNLHVIENANKISVITSNGEVYDAALIGQDKKTDIALVKINVEDTLSSVVFGDSDMVKVGDWVLAIGNPFGLGSSVTAGIISAKSRDIGDSPYNNYLQTDASINQGNSGGPMFNIDGEVVGINTAIFSNSGTAVGVGFALPSNDVKWILQELKENGSVQRSWLGVELKKATAKEGLSGFVIVSFIDMNLAKRNGFEIGDMILEYDSNKSASLKDFSYYISRLEPQTEVKVKLWRNGEIMELNVIVENKDNNENKISENKR